MTGGKGKVCRGDAPKIVGPKPAADPRQPAKFDGRSNLAAPPTKAVGMQSTKK